MKLVEQLQTIRAIGRASKIVPEQGTERTFGWAALSKLPLTVLGVVAAALIVPPIVKTVEQNSVATAKSNGWAARPGAAAAGPSPAGGAGQVRNGSAGSIGDGFYKVYYGPGTNLESTDLAILRAAHESINAALYSWSDMRICREMANAAQRGVRVRVYRDGSEYDAEEQRGIGGQTCAQLLLSSGAEVRVKQTEGLMHLKSYAVDGKVLRTGSANLSRSAEAGDSVQDNDVVFLRSSTAASQFEQEFEAMWQRPSNLKVRARRP